MNKQLPYPFLVEIRKVRPRIFGFRPFLFKVVYNNFTDISNYKQNLDSKLHSFYHRLTYVPNKFQANSYDKHLLILKGLLSEIEFNVKRKQQKIINRKFPECKEFYENVSFQQIENENSKICKMFCIQNKYIQKSIKILENITQLDNKTISKQSIDTILSNKFKTNLTNAELSLFSKLFFDVITESNYNKTDLSKLLSHSFETRTTKNPSEKKLYQFFNKTTPEVKAKIKDLIFQLKLIAQR